jgi:transposase InsO family protein
MHRNAPLTPEGRLRLCQRVEAGWPVAHAAAAMGISRPTAYKWWRRYCSDGVAGLVDRSSRPHRSPNQTRPGRERRITTLRTTKGLGPARIAGIVNMHASTVHRVLTRAGLNRLDQLDRPTREPIRRIVTDHCGELVHVDVKKVGKIPKGGGWRSHGRGHPRPNNGKVGYAYVHTAIDAHSRLAYSEVLDNEQGVTAARFWTRAASFFERRGIAIERVLTDNGSCYRSHHFTTALGEGIKHKFTRPYRPQTNGKVERFNRTLTVEWAYARAWTSEGQRTRALAYWLHIYNHHRHHTAIGGPPISRVNNLPGQYS